jgi:hypothetical protein
MSKEMIINIVECSSGLANEILIKSDTTVEELDEAIENILIDNITYQSEINILYPSKFSSIVSTVAKRYGINASVAPSATNGE